MARDKKTRRDTQAVNLFGDAFGAPRLETPVKPHKAHKRSASLAPTMTPLYIDGVPYVPQQQMIYTAPIQQQYYPYFTAVPVLQAPQHPPTPQLPQQQQITYSPPEPPKPMKEDFETLRKIDAHYNTNFGSALQKHASDPALKAKTENKTEVKISRTTITVTKHICAQCGRVRSNKYHHRNPITPGVEPVPAFCGKCQREASSTSGSDDDRKSKEKKDSKNKSKKKKNQQKVKTSLHISDCQLTNFAENCYEPH